VAYLSFSDFESQISTNLREENLGRHTWATSNALSFVGDSKKLTLFSWPLTLFGQHDVALPNINILKYATFQSRDPTDLQKKYALLDYCINHWADHTKEFSSANTDLWNRFTQLALEKQRWFEFKPWNDRYSSRSYPFMSMFSWALEAGHRGLLESLLNPPIGPRLEEYFKFHAGGVKNALYDAVSRGHLAVADFLSFQPGSNVHDPLLFLVAAEKNHLDVVRFLALKAGGALYQLGDRSQPLHLLTKSSTSLRAAIETYLLSSIGRFSINNLDDQNKSPLYYAAENGHSDVVRLLLAHGKLCRKGETVSALAAAIRKGHLEIAQQLLKAGARVVGRDEKDELGRTPMHWVAKTGNRDMALTLYERGLDVNAQDCDLRTPLHYAAIFNHLPVMSLLHSLGADVSLEDKYQKKPREYVPNTCANHIDEKEAAVSSFVTRYLTRGICDCTAPTGEQKLSILRAAAGEGNHDILKLLATEGPYMTEPGPREETILYRAVEHEDHNMVEVLLAAGADIDSRPSTLHLAINMRRDRMLQLLMDEKPDTSITDADSHTPLEQAVSLEYEGGIRILLKGGAYSGIGMSGFSPTYQAARSEKMLVLRMLLEGGADTSSGGHPYGDTPLHIMVTKERIGGVRTLLEHGADPGVKDFFGNTPLHWAAKFGFLEGVKLLLEHVKDADEYNGEGQTPLMLAAGNGHQEVEERIRDHTFRHHILKR
jgi:ankyrin repeat protein